MEANDLYQTQLRTRRSTQKKSNARKTTSTSTATQTTYKKKKPVGKMVLFGGVSLCAYLFLFFNEQLITKTFTLGGWHAAFPVMTAFLFSFVHGAFASNLLSVLGLEAKK